MNFDAAREEFLALMHTLEEDVPHVQHVARLAAHLFDELSDLHGLGEQDRFLLDAASHLHDIGHSVATTSKGHHRESARLIREHGWQHFASHSVEIIAQVARYHRKSPPDLEHEEFAALGPLERQRVQRLAALLRVADGLDRSHRQHITHCSVEILPGRIVFHLSATNPVPNEITSATKKSDLAQSVFQREITFSTHPAMHQ
ncbi:MAG: HD domain-containing protein [Verrucomicrobia bacterium]|nr:HD domain-containing protein [Verrucomicrobiota bacterium]